MQQSALQLILEAGYVVKTVLVILLLFSIVSWAITWQKWRHFAKADKESHDFFRAYEASNNPKDLYTISRKYTLSPLASLYRSVFSEKTYTEKEELKRMLRRYSTLEATRLQRHLNFLATTGSTSPFIGLFGTVWGIMNAFRGIGSAGSASLAVVAPGIAEALITTAMGLAAAIPAVVAYNFYLSKSNRMIIEMEDFSEELFDFIPR